ncbi:MAG: barstar family protein [Christensenella sp.]|nr:barstar family protein [Christensenella sp.]
MMKHEKRLALNARRMTTREQAHAHIKERLRLPDWYGNNLDALNDCLGEIGEPTQIILRFAPLLEQNLGEYGLKLIRVLENASTENENIRVVLRSGF